MPVMDEFKEERAAMKHGTPKQKFNYFLDYYKWHVIIAVAVIGFIGSLVYHSLTSKENAFYAALVNVYELTSTEEHIQSFAEYAGIDTGEYSILFDSNIRINNAEIDQDSIASSQKLMVYIAAGELDIIMSDEAIIEQYAYNDSFCDLREILTEEQLTAYEPYFYYMDKAVAEAVSAAKDDPNYDYTQSPSRPDPRKPENMERPVPIGIYLADAESLNNIYLFLNGDGVLAVSATSQHLETIPKYVDFLFQQ